MRRKGFVRVSAVLALAVTAPWAAAGPPSAGSAPSSAESPETSPPLPAQSVILDRAVAVINGAVILQSDVSEEMRFSVLQPSGVDPQRDTPQDALRRLINRELILQQMRLERDLPSPTGEQVRRQLQDLRNEIPECVQYHCASDAGWQAFLRSEGLTEPMLEQYWRQRMIVLSLIQERFGGGVRISAAEIRQYYDHDFVPEFKRRNLTAPPLTGVSARIQQILLQQRVTTLLQDWLRSLRGEGGVSILDPAFGQLAGGGEDTENDAGGEP